jgi:transcriptional repressor NrdR
MVMARLKELDNIAYIRFASIYRDFADITDLKQEVDTLIDASDETIRTGDQLSLLPDDKQKALTGGRQKRRR